MCQRAFGPEDIAQCFGEFVLQADGSLCTLQSLNTDVERAVLACGPCQAMYTW
jgi:hypothetical protein